MPDDDAPSALLIVCQANVCRSSVAEFVLATRLSGWQVDSAGMRVSKGAKVCDLGASVLLDDDRFDGAVAESFCSSFRSEAVRPEALGRYGMILTATREIRSGLIRARPDLMNRIFTMREAVVLLGAVVPEVRGGDRLLGLTARMNRARDRVPMPDPKVRRLGPAPTNPADIPDGHSRTRRHHLATLHLSINAAFELADQLSAAAMPICESPRRSSADDGREPYSIPDERS